MTLGMGFGRFGRMGRTHAIQAAGGAPALLPLSSRIVYLGDSFTAAQGFTGYAQWAHFYSRGRYYLRRVGSNGLGPTGWLQGVSGNKTDDGYARRTNVTDENPKVVVILLGINDIIVSGRPASTIQTNLRALYNYFLGFGIKVVGVTPAPCNPSGWNAGLETIRATVRDWILAQADLAARVNLDLAITDIPSQIDSADGLHPNSKGGQAIGSAVGAAIATLTLPDDILYVPPTAPAENIVLNPFFAGGTTTATSWSRFDNTNGLTKTYSKTTFGGNVAQKIVVAGTTTANVQDIFYQQVTAAGGVIGDVYEFWMEFNSTKLTGITGIAMEANRGGSGASHFSVSSQADVTNAVFPITGVVRSAGFVLTSNDQSMQSALSFIPGGGLVVDAEIIVNRAGLRKIPPGQ